MLIISLKEDLKLQYKLKILIVESSDPTSKLYRFASFPLTSKIGKFVTECARAPKKFTSIQNLPDFIFLIPFFKVGLLQKSKLTCEFIPFETIPNLSTLRYPKVPYFLGENTLCHLAGRIFKLSSPSALGIVKVFDPSLLDLQREAGGKVWLQLLMAFGFLAKKSSRPDPYRLFWEDADLIFHQFTRMSSQRNGRLYPHGNKFIQVDKFFGQKAVSNPRRFKRRSHRGTTQSPLRRLDVLRVLSSLEVGSYPSAGAIYENGIFLVVRKCEGLVPGLYEFDQQAATLVKRKGIKKYLGLLLEGAKYSWGKENGTPSALIILTSKFAKISTRYKGIAYRLTLLNAGVMIGALDRACSKHNIGGCPLGNGDSVMFQAATGLSLIKETSIAEFALGGSLD